MCLQQFEHDATKIIFNLKGKYRTWDGDIASLPTDEADSFCYHFLQHHKGHWDDEIGISLVNQEQMLHTIFSQRDKNTRLSRLIKSAIMESLGENLRYIVQNLHDEHYGSSEPFAGYRVGE